MTEWAATEGRTSPRGNGVQFRKDRWGRKNEFPGFFLNNRRTLILDFNCTTVNFWSAARSVAGTARFGAEATAHTSAAVEGESSAKKNNHAM